MKAKSTHCNKYARGGRVKANVSKAGVTRKKIWLWRKA